MFNFDKFVNEPCIGKKGVDGELVEGIFGQKAEYIPDDNEIEPFGILIDFHKAYEQVQLKVLELPLSSTEIVGFIRLCNMPEYYPKIMQGDNIKVKEETFQIIDVQYHIPGTQKVILHEDTS